MKKTLIAIAAAATLGFATVAAPQPAQARHGGVAAGIIGGLAFGTLLGAAAAANGPYAYAPGPVYYGPACYWTRQRIWDGWGWHWRRVRVCN
jgi:4-amino-4-deoxy-L-arabinose transferase-like glycosyltransferase